MIIYILAEDVQGAKLKIFSFSCKFYIIFLNHSSNLFCGGRQRRNLRHDTFLSKNETMAATVKRRRKK